MSDVESGLARERTRLSWRRTTLSAAVAAILLELKVLNQASAVTATLVGLIVAAGWFALVLVSYRRIRALDAGDTTAPRHAPALIGWLVLAFAGIGLVVTLTLR